MATARQAKIKDNQDNTEHKETCLDIPDVHSPSVLIFAVGFLFCVISSESDKSTKALQSNYYQISFLKCDQGCISCGILVSGIRARGVSSEHMENMEMFSCSPT